MGSVERAFRTALALVALVTLPGLQPAEAQESEEPKPETPRADTTKLEAGGSNTSLAESDAPALVRADAAVRDAEGAEPVPAEVEDYDLQPSQERLLRAVLDASQMADVVSMGIVLAQTGSLDDVRERWEELVRETRPHAANLHLIVRAVLRESYHEANREAHRHADKVRFYDQLIASLNGEIQRVEEEASFDRSGMEEWEEYRDELRETLALVEEAAQRANADLERALQRQRETLGSLASLAVMLRDSGMAALP